jgi:hypothetical protein
MQAIACAPGIHERRQQRHLVVVDARISIVQGRPDSLLRGVCGHRARLASEASCDRRIEG